jgi:hypothetical protein
VVEVVRAMFIAAGPVGRWAMNDAGPVENFPHGPRQPPGFPALAGFAPPSRRAQPVASSRPRQLVGSPVAGDQADRSPTGQGPDRPDGTGPDAGERIEHGPAGAAVAPGAPAGPQSRQEATAPPLGRAQSGRHREHLFPRRGHRLQPSFTAEEYAVVVAAASGVGLTPTGFCARAALHLAITAPSSSNVDAEPGRTGAISAAEVRGEGLAAVQAELAALRAQVVRVGTNLNQAMAAFHATGEAPVWLEHVVAVCGRALAAVDSAASGVHRRLR